VRRNVLCTKRGVVGKCMGGKIEAAYLLAFSFFHFFFLRFCFI